MTTTLAITPWDEHGITKKYVRASPYVASVEADHRFRSILDYIDNAVRQLRLHSGPRGIHFGEWSGTQNVKSNLKANHAMLLDYDIRQFEELRAACDRLNVGRFYMTTENKARTQNTISLVIPFSTPVDAATYERVTSCIVKELDVYGLVDGVLSSTFVTNIHATTMTVFERGPLFDAEAFKVRTAHLYRRQDAHKYYQATRPVSLKAVIEREKPLRTSHDGLFEGL
jgi:hypothetical protein